MTGHDNGWQNLRVCLEPPRNKLTLVKMTSVQRGRGPAQTLPSDWEQAVTGWLGWLKLSGVSVNTMKLRRGHVRMIAARSATSHPRLVTIAVLTELCGREWSNEHRRSVRTALIDFYGWAQTHDYADENPALLLPRVPGDSPRPRPAPDDVWRDLLAAAAPRERMMARLAAEAGMRRAEVAQCHRDDLIHDLSGWALIVRGKGNKQRVVPIPENLAATIVAYCPRGYLFPGDHDGHLSARYVGELISALMPPGWTMHKLRHRYASRGYAATRNLRAVQLALGHASVATTERYTMVTNDEVRLVSEAAGHDDEDEPA